MFSGSIVSKYIEEFVLDFTVGVDDNKPYPQIKFLPDGARDREPTTEEMQKFERIVQLSSLVISLQTHYGPSQYPIPYFSNTLKNSLSIMQYKGVIMEGFTIEGLNLKSSSCKIPNHQTVIWRIDIKHTTLFLYHPNFSQI